MRYVLPFVGRGAATGAGPTSWTFTYTSLWSTGVVVPTQANMSDGSTATYWGNSPGVSNENITADFGAAVTLSSISYRAAPASGGWGTAYTDGRTLQHSLDGSSWTTLTAISGSSETVTNTYTLGTPVSARYVRLVALGSTDYVSVSEFSFA